MYKITVPTIVTNGHFNKEKTLSELKRCGAHRVALAIDREIDYTFSAPENLNLIEELTKYYKKNGFETLIWLGETLGHSGGPVTNRMKYTYVRPLGAQEDINALCPMDESFIADFSDWVKSIAACGPDMIMLDDDFRLGIKGGIGCCCDLHLHALEKDLGEKLCREDLPSLVFEGGKNKYRTAWLKAQGNSLKSFAKALRNAVNEINPEVRLGYCTTPCSWDSDGTDPIELANIFAGKTKPFLRSFGAPYHVRLAMQKLGAVVEHTRTQGYWCKNSGVELMSEGDTYPRPRTASTPAAYLECYDMILRATDSTDGILKYMLDYVSHGDYETGYVDAMLRNRKNYELIAKHFDGKTCTGVRPFVAKQLFENGEFSYNAATEEELQWSLRSAAANFSAQCSLPTSYEKGGVNLCFGEHARHIPLEDLSLGNVIDYPAAVILEKRGVDVGISFAEPYTFPEAKGFTDLPCEYFPQEDNYVRLNPGPSLQNIKTKKDARVLSYFKAGNDTVSGAFEYTNNQGMSFLVLPFDVQRSNTYGWLDSYCRRRQVTSFVNRAGTAPLDAYLEGNHPGMYIITKKSHNKLAVGLWNLFEDTVYNCPIILAHPVKDITYINCAGTTDKEKEGTVTISTPIYPFSFAGFEISL